jgi:serine/threonine protein kinase
MKDDIRGAFINQYKLISLIGPGAYGLVYLAQDSYTNQHVAIKCVSKKNDCKVKKQSDSLGHQLRDYLEQNDFSAQSLRPLNLKKLAKADTIPCPFVREVSLHLQVHDHPNVITIHKILDSPVAIFIVMDYFEESDLFVNIVDRQVYAQSPKLIKDVFTQLIDVISYCHSRGIYHCDIKPENIMVANTGSKVVIGDFGLAVKSRYIQAKTCIGSSYYMPPERLVSMNHELTRLEYPAEKGDLWSLAVILINLCCTRNPWMKACEQDATYRAYRRDQKVLMDILNVSEELFDILKDCLREEPDERITLFELRDRVIRCRSFTKSGPLSHCDVDQGSFEEALECAVPNELSSDSDDSLEIPINHLVEYADYLKELGSRKYYNTVENDGDNVSMMTNVSFNMNVM